MSKRLDLEERLVDFAVRVINVVEALPTTKAGNHIAGQLVRAGTLKWTPKTGQGNKG